MNEVYQSGIATVDITSFTVMNPAEVFDGTEDPDDEEQVEAHQKLVAPYQYILKQL